MEVFQRAFSMFTPFARREGEPAAAEEKPSSPGTDLDELRRQLSDMQKKVDKLGGGEK